MLRPLILDRELHLGRLFAAFELSEACLDTQHRGLCRIALAGHRRTCEQRLNFAQLFAEGRVLHRDLLMLWDGRRHHPMAALSIPDFIASMRRQFLALCYTKARCAMESKCRRFLSILRSCYGCGQREVEAMVPSWRYCMRGADACDIASVRPKTWVAVCTIAT